MYISNISTKTKSHSVRNGFLFWPQTSGARSLWFNRLRTRLDALHISIFTLQGSTPKEKRAAMVKAFNAGGASVFLISLKAGGTGLNLTAADIVIHYAPWWNQAAQDQATDRVRRARRLLKKTHFASIINGEIV